jgi:hypothetical protein
VVQRDTSSNRRKNHRIHGDPVVLLHYGDTEKEDHGIHENSLIPT